MARRRGTSWQGSLKTADKYYRYSFPTEALAEEWERSAREAKRNGEPIPEPTLSEDLRPTLRQFYRRHKGMACANVKENNHASNQRMVENWLGPDIRINEINERVLLRMVEKMSEAGNSPSTMNSRLSHIRTLLRYAKKLALVDLDVEVPFQKVGDNSRLRFLTEEEERTVITLLNHWGLSNMVHLVGTLIDTGCRPGELLHSKSNVPIKWSEVSVSAGGTAPDVNDPKTGEAKAVISLMRTKTGKYRVLPLTDRAKAAFLVSKQQGDSRPFGDLTVDQAGAYFRDAVNHLGYEDVVLYTLRHTCASRLVQRGADLRRVMQWMGHTNINTTLRYAKLTPTDIFELETLL